MSVTSARGFVASGVHAQIRREKRDLALLRSLVPALQAEAELREVGRFGREQVVRPQILRTNGHAALLQITRRSTQ